jgi:hypothetical protein
MWKHSIVENIVECESYFRISVKIFKNVSRNIVDKYSHCSFNGNLCIVSRLNVPLDESRLLSSSGFVSSDRLLSDDIFSRENNELLLEMDSTVLYFDIASLVNFRL